MPDMSLQELQQADVVLQRIMPLLNQADMDLQQVKACVQNFEKAHNLNSNSAAALNEAISGIEQFLGQAVGAHNQLLGQIAAAQTEVQSRPAEAPQQ